MSDTDNKVNPEELQILNLLDLPIVVLDGILDWLDSNSLKTLRLVSRTTNSLIENPRHLQKFRMGIKSSNLHEIIYSPAKYPDCVIKLNRVTNWNALTPFLQHSKTWLTNFKIQCQLIPPKQVVNILLNIGPQLRTFATDGNLQNSWKNNPQRTSSLELQEMEKLIEDSDHILKENLIGLQEFDIASTTSEELCSITCLFHMFLKYCPALVTLNIPLIKTEINFPIDAPDGSAYLPLFNYLTKISLVKPRYLSKINFWKPSLQYDQFTMITKYQSLFPLTSTTLTELLKLCEPIKVKLHNVSPSVLPDSQYLTRNEKKCLRDVVGSVLIMGTPIISNTRNIPSGCPINLVFSENWRNVAFHPPDILDQLNVVSITLIYEMMRDIPMDQVLPTLLRTNRPTITDLKLYGQRAVEEIKTSGLSIFPNLKKLYLNGNPDRYLDNLNRTRIPSAVIDRPNLESLDLGFLGVQFDESLGEGEIDRWLTEMKKLQHFSLSSCKLSLNSAREIYPPPPYDPHNVVHVNFG